MESLGVRKEGGGEGEKEEVVDMHEGTGEEGITVEFA
jgi:hypothetical protein